MHHCVCLCVGMGWAKFPHRIQPPNFLIPSNSLNTLNPTNTKNSSKTTKSVVLGMDYMVTKRIPSLQTLPTIRTLQVLQSIGLVIQNPKPPSPVHSFPRKPGHFFSSESSWTSKTQPAGGRAAVWLCFWCSTRPSANTGHLSISNTLSSFGKFLR